MQENPENIFQTAAAEGEANILLIDESLETRTASLCELLVALEPDSMQLALKERKGNRFLALESFFPSTEAYDKNWKEALEQLSRNSHLLRNYEFSRAIVGVFSPAYTFVPDSIFKTGDEKLFIDFNFRKNGQSQKLFSRHVNAFHVQNVFAVQEELHKEITHLFEEPELIHMSSTLLESVHVQSRGKKEKEIFLNIRKGHLDAIVVEGKKLLLVNSYDIPGPEDLLYFSLLICDQLEIDPDSVVLKIAGEIEKESARYKLLYQYFRNIRFSARPANLSYSYRFDKTPSHRHYSLFSLALCAS